jgi:hypothetical protein
MRGSVNDSLDLNFLSNAIQKENAENNGVEMGGANEEGCSLE